MIFHQPRIFVLEEYGLAVDVGGSHSGLGGPKRQNALHRQGKCSAFTRDERKQNWLCCFLDVITEPRFVASPTNNPDLL